MTRFETLTLLIALITVVVSVVKLVHTRHKKEELTGLQLRLLHVPPVPSADVIIFLESSYRGRFEIPNWWHGAARFEIENLGHGAARNVDLKFKLRPGQHDPLVAGDYDQWPIPELRPRGRDRVTLQAALTPQTGTTFDVTLTWTDPDGSVQHRDDQVSLRMRSFRLPVARNTAPRDIP